jgi:hypothetical protein
VRRVLVHSADGFDEIRVVLQRGLHVEGLLEAEFGKSTEVWDVVLVCDGVDVDEVGGV